MVNLITKCLNRLPKNYGMKNIMISALNMITKRHGRASTVLQSIPCVNRELLSRRVLGQEANHLVSKPHIACPGQDVEGTVLTSKSSKLSKIHRLVSELRFRIERRATNTADFNITLKLQNKVAFELKNLKGFEWWEYDHHLSAAGLNCVQNMLQKNIIDQRSKEKRARIHAWKQRMISSTKSKQVDKCVFQWINGKTKDPSPNLILNQNGDYSCTN